MKNEQSTSSINDMIDGKLIKRSGISGARCQVVESNINGYETHILIYAVGYPEVRQWVQLQREGAFYHWTYLAEMMPEATDREVFDVTQAMEAMGFHVSYEPEFLKKMVEWGEVS